MVYHARGASKLAKKVSERQSPPLHLAFFIAWFSLHVQCDGQEIEHAMKNMQ
jgi:hypothetical protein